MHTAPNYPASTQLQGDTAPFTYDSYISKTGVALAIMMLSGAAGILALPVTGGWGILAPSIAAFIVAIVAQIRSSRGTPVAAASALGYSALQGFALGGLSALLTGTNLSVVASAVAGTFIVAGLCLAAYKMPGVRVTPKFRKVAAIALFAVFILYLVNIVASFFVDGGIGLHSGPWSVVVSIVVIVIASLNMVVHFDDVNEDVARQAPDKVVGWGHTLDFAVLFVWLYLEILRLLANRD